MFLVKLNHFSRFLTKFGCRVGNLNTSCLGVLLGVGHKSSEILYGVIEKVKRKLSNWKKKGYLSSGGRVVLINNILDSFSFGVSLFPIPAKVE